MILGGNTGSSSPYGFHDWEYILTEAGLYRYTDVLARATFAAGAFIMVLSLVWGGILLLKQYGSLKEQVGKTE